MLIGELSRRSGLSRDTLRYYTKLGLLHGSGRNPHNHYTQFDAGMLTRIAQIGRLKRSGFTLGEIRSLLDQAANAHPCSALPERVQTKLADIEQQLAELRAVRLLLTGIAARCTARCGNDDCGLPSCLTPADDALGQDR